MDFHVESYRMLGKPVFVSNNFRYVKSSSKGNTRYLKCALFRDGCPGTARIKGEPEGLTELQEHNHDEEAYKMSKHAVGLNVRGKSKDDTALSIREIFDKSTGQAPNQNLTMEQFGFQQLQSGMYKSRRSRLPPQPVSTNNFADIVQQSPFGQFTKGSVEHEGEISYIFFSHEINHIWSHITDINLDGTFFTCPGLWKQFYTVCGTYSSNSFPLIFILMTGKSEALYTKIFYKLKELLPTFCPKNAMADFEMAVRKSLLQVFPDIKVSGCLFHHQQCLYKKVQNSGFSNSYAQNPVFRRWIKAVMSLPSLPLENIEPTYQLLCGQDCGLTQDLRPNLEKFKNYYQRTWLARYLPEHICVSGLENITNNACESFHAKMKRRVKVHHPSIWVFLEKLQELANSTSTDIVRVESTVIISREPMKETVRVQAMRKRIARKLTNYEITPLQFVYVLATLLGAKWRWHWMKETGTPIYRMMPLLRILSLCLKMLTKAINVLFALELEQIQSYSSLVVIVWFVVTATQH